MPYAPVSSMYKDQNSHSYFTVNYKENFKHGYKLVSHGETLLQKFGYDTQDQAHADALAVKKYGTHRELYNVAPVKPLNCYSVTLQHDNAQLIGFKSGFESQEAAQAHVNYLVQIIQELDTEPH